VEEEREREGGKNMVVVKFRELICSDSASIHICGGGGFGSGVLQG
jgi:hypothetical protein